MTQDIPRSFRQEQKQQVGNVSIDGQGHYVDFSQKQYIQISVDEIKTKPFIKASPYKGLKKFDSSEWDAKRFWGREQLIEDLRKDLDVSNMLLLLGASGSGKSSVVSAGLIPKLAEEWGANLVTLTLTPDENPFESLYASLLRSSFKQADAKIARQAKPTTLTRIVNQKSKDSFWLIFLDQFEELFTLSSEQERNNFIAGLIYLHNALERAKWRSVKVIMTMRADFSDRLSPYAEFSNITKGQIRFIADMQEHELRRAIEQPAAHHGVVFEEGLVEEIIKDVQGQAASLPLLQYTLDQLWQRESISDQMRSLRKKTYWTLGGVSGALQNRVDEIYRQLCQAGKERAVKQIFLRLVSIDGSRVARRRAYRNEFETDPTKNAIIDELIQEALLVSNVDRAGQRTVEIAHEALFASWSTLKNWIAEDGQAIALKNRLADAVGRWLKVSADEADSELWRGSTLEEVVRLRQEGAFERLDIALNSDESRFVNASLEQVNRLEQEKEEQRQKELQQERQAREAAQKIAEQETKARRNAQKTTVGALVSGLALAAIAAFSAIQYRQSQINQVHTLRLSAEASLALGQDLDALLTALRAGRQFKQLFFPPDELQEQVTETLRTVFYSANERDRWTWDQGEAKEVFVTPNKQMFLTTSNETDPGQIRLLDLKNNTSPIRLEGNSKAIFNPQGDQVAFIEESLSNNIEESLSDNRQILLFNLGGEPLTPPMEAADAIFSPNGELLLIKNDDSGNVRVLNRQDQLIDQFNGIGQQEILGYNFDSHQLVTSIENDLKSDDYIIQVWNQEGSKKVLQSQDASGIPILGILPKSTVFSSNGQALLILGWDGVDSSDFELWQYQEFCGLLVSPCWSDSNRPHSSGNLDSVDVVNPNYGSNKELVAVAAEGTISLSNEYGQLIDELGGSLGRLQDVTFSHDGRLLASVGDDRLVRLWELQGSQPRRINELDEQFQDVSFSSGKGQFVIFQQDGTIKLWNFNGKLLLEFHSQITQIKDIDLSNDGKYLAIVDENGSSHLWTIQNDKLSAIPLSIQGINAITFSPNSQDLATAGKDGFVRVWNLQGAKQQELDTKLITTEGDQGIRDIVFTPDGQSIIINETLWSLNDHSQVATLDTSGSSVVFKPSGEGLYVVNGGDGGSDVFRLENLQGVPLVEFQNPPGKFFASIIQLSPTGTLFAAAERNRVLVWNTSGQLLTTFQINPGSSEDQVDPIEKLTFSPDGQRLITITEGGLMTLWSLGDLDELIVRSCDWVRDYIAHSPELEDRSLCDGIGNIDSPTAVSVPSPSSSSTNPQSSVSTPASEAIQIAPTASSVPITTQQTSVQTSPPLITQEEALNLIKEWLQQKQQVFSSPYDLEILGRYATGAYYELKQREVERLREVSTELQFSGLVVEPTGVFSTDTNQAVIGVGVTETCTYVRGETTEDCSSQSHPYTYTLRFDGVQWKIIASVKEG